MVADSRRPWVLRARIRKTSPAALVKSASARRHVPGMRPHHKRAAAAAHTPSTMATRARTAGIRGVYSKALGLARCPVRSPLRGRRSQPRQRDQAGRGARGPPPRPGHHAPRGPHAGRGGLRPLRGPLRDRGDPGGAVRPRAPGHRGARPRLGEASPLGPGAGQGPADGRPGRWPPAWPRRCRRPCPGRRRGARRVAGRRGRPRCAASPCCSRSSSIPRWRAGASSWASRCASAAGGPSRRRSS